MSNKNSPGKGSPERHVFVCSWSPPMAGGPRNLYSHLKGWDPNTYAIITSYLNFSWSHLDPSTWLPVPYEYFDFEGIPNKESSKVTVTPSEWRFKFMDKFDSRMISVSKLWAKLFKPNPDLFDTIYQFGRSLRVAFACYSFGKRHRIKSIVIISDMGWGFIGGFLYAKIFRKPLTVFLFDLFADNYMLSGNKILAKFFEPAIFRYASKFIVTNEHTANFLRAKYPKMPEITVVRNSSDLEARKIDEVKHHNNNFTPPATIAFAGHGYWPHIESLTNLVNAIQLLKDVPIKLKLFIINPTDEMKDLIKGKGNIELGQMPRAELFEELKKAHLLFIPFGWNTKSQEIIQTASPAKFTDYLAVGVPLLIHAPENSYVADVTQEKNLGLVVTENSAEVLAEKIRMYFHENRPQASQMAANCVQFYQNEFLVEKNSNRLWSVIDA